MGVTLSGHRTVGFGVKGKEFDFFKLPMSAGDVYVSSPAGIFHGIFVDKLSAKEPSLAIQFRTLLSAEAAAAYHGLIFVLDVSLTFFSAQKNSVRCCCRDAQSTSSTVAKRTTDRAANRSNYTRSSKRKIRVSKSSRIKNLLARFYFVLRTF
jgi:hypothetical protein